MASLRDADVERRVGGMCVPSTSSSALGFLSHLGKPWILGLFDDATPTRRAL
jgi:hypothetical protein